MNAVPVIPESAPFTPAQKAWLNGFLAGLFSREPSNAAAPAARPAIPISILYASQTGTSERLAKKASKLAAKSGFAPTIMEVSKLNIATLAEVDHALLLTSTYGDGEAPDAAKALLSELQSTNGAPLARLKFSLCALGDSKYSKFCQAGKDFDRLLEALGAVRLTERVDCDVGEDEKYSAWLNKSLACLKELCAPNSKAACHSPSTAPSTPASEEAKEEAKEANEEEEEEEALKPVAAPVLELRRVNAVDSGKEVNHVAFSLEGSKLSYCAGDALSVTPSNAPSLVAEILSRLACDGEEAVKTHLGEYALRRALEELYDLGKPSAALCELLELPANLTPFHVIDALLSPEAKLPSAADFVKALKRLQPRLYSISSSPLAHKNEVHLTVGAVRYEQGGRKREGVASTFLADRALASGKVLINVHRNNGFRLPSDGSAPVIMIGPGTGIAPFRCFLHERKALGATGGNWLFFGDQHEATDFLYREELLPLEASGFVRLSLAWSRDQAEKIYVQNRMLEQAAEFWSWLEKGAYLYVCGDASRMAKDVDAALHKLIEVAGGKSAAEALAYVEQLKRSRRYQRDVY